ncbi:unnamed protein product [Sphagnum tenellum]
MDTDSITRGVARKTSNPLHVQLEEGGSIGGITSSSGIGNLVAPRRSSVELDPSDTNRVHLRAVALSKRKESFHYAKGTVSVESLVGEEASQPRLSAAVSAMYGAPQFSILSLYMLMSVNVTPYYQTIGASLSYLAFFTAFARSWDCLTDPFMGYVTDSTRSRWGRRKPFIFIGAPMFALFSVFLLSPGPELSDNTVDRSRMYFIQSIFGLLGTLVGAAAPALATQFIESSGSPDYNATLIQIAGGVGADGSYLVPLADAQASAYNLAQDRGFFAVAIFFAAIYLLAMYPMVSFTNATSKLLGVFIGKGDTVLAAVVVALNGLPLGGQFITPGLLADVIDYDEFLTGERREAQFTMFSSIDGVNQEQPPLTRLVIQFIYIGFPVLCNTFTLFYKMKYPIKEESYMSAVSEGIVLHQKNLPARDPVTLKLTKPPLVLLTKEARDKVTVMCFFVIGVVTSFYL